MRTLNLSGLVRIYGRQNGYWRPMDWKNRRFTRILISASTHTVEEARAEIALEETRTPGIELKMVPVGSKPWELRRE